MALKEYLRKRDFKKTGEPRGRVNKSSSGHRFVIQKHAASRLHYDFRLEIDGALKSWAVPKGPPYARGEKRLAVQVEDHPISYIDFEGTIPKGQYGGGTVMVWDCGAFETPGGSALEEWKSGKLHFTLHGKKLNGDWHLVRTRTENNWLLIKSGEDMKPVSPKMEDASAITGRSMAQISQGANVWQSNRPAKNNPPKTVRPAAQPEAKIAFVPPMMARLASGPPTSGEWIFEVKLDGFRALAFKNGDLVSLLSRNEKDFGRKFPEIYDDIGKLTANSFIIDGEIVALDAKGRSAFQLLQAYEMGEERPPIFFYAFDLLQYDGRDLREKPLADRKAELEKLLENGPAAIRFSLSLQGDAGELLRRARKLGLEGLIAKRADSKYEAGRRSGAWLKLKLHQEQEMVIGGYTAPEGARHFFGALLIGYYAGEKFLFAGKVGTGFNEKLLGALHAKLQQIEQPDCPFANLPEKRSGRFGAGVTLAEMRCCRWVKPQHVCQIKFSEWTRDGKLRQPVFLGLRDDKEAREVAREVPA